MFGYLVCIGWLKSNGVLVLFCVICCVLVLWAYICFKSKINNVLILVFRINCFIPHFMYLCGQIVGQD